MHALLVMEASPLALRFVFVSSRRQRRRRRRPAQVILPDYLPGNPFSPLNQPVWCTYANGARSAILVSESGTVFYQQTWLDSTTLGNAIDAYWKQEGTGTWTSAPLAKGPLGPASRSTDSKGQKQPKGGPQAQIGKSTP